MERKIYYFIICCFILLNENGYASNLGFDKMQLDFGDVYQGELLSRKVKISNLSGKPTQILKHHSDCGCVICLLYTSPSPRDKRQSRMPSSA